MHIHSPTINCFLGRTLSCNETRVRFKLNDTDLFQKISFPNSLLPYFVDLINKAYLIKLLELLYIFYLYYILFINVEVS